MIDDGKQEIYFQLTGKVVVVGGGGGGREVSPKKVTGTICTYPLGGLKFVIWYGIGCLR